MNHLVDWVPSWKLGCAQRKMALEEEDVTAILQGWHWSLGKRISSDRNFSFEGLNPNTD